MGMCVLLVVQGVFYFQMAQWMLREVWLQIWLVKWIVKVMFLSYSQELILDGFVIGQRTMFVLTKVDMAEANGIKQERVSIIISFSHSFVHSFVRSFIHSVIQSFIL